MLHLSAWGVAAVNRLANIMLSPLQKVRKAMRLIKALCSLLAVLPMAGRLHAQCAEWSGSFRDAFNGDVLAMATFDDGSGTALYAGGAFTAVNQVSAPHIARWNGSGWSALGGPGSGMNGDVYALAIFDDGSGPALYAGGEFTIAGGGVPALHIAKWNGTTWSALGLAGDGSNGFVSSLIGFEDGSGHALYVGGSFTIVGGVSASAIARWSGVSWSALGSGLTFNGSAPPVAYSLAVYDGGSGPALFVGGRFFFAGGVLTPDLAKWDGSAWSSVGQPMAGATNIVFALTTFNDGSSPALFAGGAFTAIGGVPATSIAKWNGSIWSSLGGMNNTVNALCVFNDGFGPALYAGGYFTTAAGTAASHIAKWNGASWSAVGTPDSGLDNGVFALAVFNDGSDGDDDLYAGGQFTSAGGNGSLHIAEWSGCGVLAFCAGDGSGAACPCANSGVANHGCNNSAGSGGAILSASGTTSPDTLELTQAGELASSLSILLQGSLQLGSPAIFGDGLRCIGGSLKRLYIKNATSGTVSAPTAGDSSMTARSAALGDTIVPGSTRFYQVYYRDPNLTFCPDPPGAAFNVGNALRVSW